MEEGEAEGEMSRACSTRSRYESLILNVKERTHWEEQEQWDVWVNMGLADLGWNPVAVCCEHGDKP
jgi:hypothetical protein